MYKRQQGHTEIIIDNRPDGTCENRADIATLEGVSLSRTGPVDTVAGAGALPGAPPGPPAPRRCAANTRSRGTKTRNAPCERLSALEKELRDGLAVA